ncbi:UNVERIFIED_CONTAM: hypothetical protein FKN15_036380 [Acipenser sinensis]
MSLQQGSKKKDKHILSGTCPDPKCQARLFFPAYGSVSIECTECGQRHEQKNLQNVEEVTDPDVVLHNLLRNALLGVTGAPKKGTELVKVMGLSNYHCKLLSPILTRYGMDKQTGKAKLLREMNQGEMFDCSLLGDRAFLIEQEHVSTVGYGKDRSGSLIYLQDTLEEIKKANGNQECLIPVHVDGDGHCLVHAVSRALVGRELFWHALRENLKQNFKENLDRYNALFQDFIDAAEWEDIINECDPLFVPPEGVPLGLRNIHIFGLANVLHRPIILLDSLSGMRSSGDYSATFLPGLVPEEKCMGKDGQFNKPICIAWSSSGRNHYIPLVGIKNASLPKLPARLLPKAWGVAQELIKKYIKLEADGSCIIGGDRSLQDKYLMRLVHAMEEVFMDKHAIHPSLVADVHQYVYRRTGVIGVQPEEVTEAARKAVMENRLHRCLICNALSELHVPPEWLAPGGKLYNLAKTTHEQLRADKNYSFPLNNLVCSYDPVKDVLMPDYKSSHLNSCNYCHGTSVRHIRGDGSVVYLDGDRTNTRSHGGKCGCGFKHFWDGKEYDNLPEAFPITLEWSGRVVRETVYWFQYETEPSLNSNVYDVAMKLVTKHFPGEFGSEILVQKVVNTILNHTAKKNPDEYTPVSIDGAHAQRLEDVQEGQVDVDVQPPTKIILTGQKAKTLHKEELNMSKAERSVQQSITEHASVTQKKRTDKLKQVQKGQARSPSPGPARDGLSSAPVTPTKAPYSPKSSKEKKIRVTTTDGRQAMLTLQTVTTFSQLQNSIAKEFSVPPALQCIRYGFPPKELSPPKEGMENEPVLLQHGDRVTVEILKDPREKEEEEEEEEAASSHTASTSMSTSLLHSVRSEEPASSSRITSRELQDHIDLEMSSLCLLATLMGEDVWSYAKKLPHLFQHGGVFHNIMKKDMALIAKDTKIFIGLGGAEKQLQCPKFIPFDEPNKGINSYTNAFPVDSEDEDDEGVLQDQDCKSAELRNSKKLLSKVKWSREEVIELVHKYGPKRWSVIAKHLHGRIGKQCRERWHNHLNPEVKKSLWTEEEDRVIYEAHKRLGNRWAEIAKLLPGRHATFPSKSLIVRNNSIKNHWNSTMRRKVEHEGYLQDESNSLCRSKHASKRRSKAYSHLDALQTQNQFVMAFPAQVIELVHKYGPKRWSVIAKHLHGRIGKQCRERWHNHLNPEVKKSLWTEEEDRVIYEAHKRLGNRWAEIAKLLPGRHATFPSKSLIVRNNSIKNHWNSTMRRKVEHEGYLQDESNSLCRSKHASKRRSKAYSHLDALQTQNQFVMAFPAQHPFDDDPDKEQRIKELELLLMSAENEVGRKRVPCQSERFASWSSSGCMTNTTVSSLEDQSVEYCRVEQPPSTAVPQQLSPSKFLAVEASAVLSSLQTIPEFAETLELIDSDPVAWSDVTSFDLSQVASPMKQTAALFPHNQECMILGYQFDGSAISDMSRNCSSSNGQMELIPLTSPVVAKFSTPPSILRRKKKERTNHSPSSEGNDTSFMDTSGVSPRNTPVKSLPFSPSQDPVAWSDVTSFDLSQVASPMKQTAALFPHNQECMILGYQFDGSAISDMSRNCSSSNGQMELIPLTSPVVAKFSTPPSILRRKKKERTNHSPSSEGNDTSFMDTSGVSPRNTPVKSLPFSPSQFFNISGNENFNLNNPALTSTPVCSQKYLVTTPLQKEMTPKGQKENAGFRTPKIRKSILAPTPRTPTPFKNALAAQEKKYGPLKMMPQPLAYLEEDIREVLKEETGMDIFLREELEPAFRAWKQEHDAPARKVRKSLVLDAWEKEGLDVNLFSQDQLSNEQPPSGNLLTCSLFMTPLLDKVEGRCSPVAVKEEPSITHQHSPSVKENPCMLRSARFETPIQMNSEWETVVYGKTEDQLIMTEQARKYLNAFNSGSTSRALVL